MGKFIEREPLKDDYSRIVFKTLDELEEYLEKKDSLRNADLSQLDFSSQRGQELLSRINGFDDKTIWPESLANEKAKQLECGKNSGLGISSLHKKGYTGKGINVAIIDSYLLIDHPEYKDNVKYYKEIGNEEFLKKYGHLPGDGKASYHGPAVASLAVGTNCGSAPGAGLYFISYGGYSPEITLTSLKHLIELNKRLPEEDKIRCVNCSWAGKGNFFRDLFKELEETGCMVFGGCYREFAHNVHGGSRICQDSESLDNLKLDEEVVKYVSEGRGDCLIVPEHQRTFATADGGYQYGERGGNSWCSPYLAGLVACALQANPDIVKQKGWQDKIWKKLFATGRPSSQIFKAKIVQPEAFVMSVIDEREKSLNKRLQKGSEKTIKNATMKGEQNE